MKSSPPAPLQPLVLRSPDALLAGIASVPGDTSISRRADVRRARERQNAGRRVTGVVVPLEQASSMIDEHPMPAVAAALTGGEPRLCGLAERRVKQCHRLATVARLHVDGVPVRVEDDMIVTGGHANDRGGGQAQAPMHHRRAMSAVVMRLAARHPVQVGDTGFVGLMNRPGAGPAEAGA